MMQMVRLGLALVVLAAGLMGVALPAQAEIFNLTSCHISTGCPAAGTIFGTVTTAQSGSDVKVDVVLNNGNLFIETGAGADSLFLFNDTISGSAVTNITATLDGTTVSIAGGLTGLTNQPTNTNPPALHADGTGNFSGAIQCITASSCNGASGADINDLHFTVTNITLAQLQTANANGNIFVADILCGATVTGCAGQTGPVDASTSVPEPGSLLFFGPLMAFAGMVGVSRWKRR